jgi:hypothetical protein
MFTQVAWNNTVMSVVIGFAYVCLCMQKERQYMSMYCMYMFPCDVQIEMLVLSFSDCGLQCLILLPGYRWQKYRQRTL